MVTMSYDEFLDLMCCDDDKGMTKESTIGLMPPKEYLVSILKDVFYLSKDYKYGNISKEHYISKIKVYFDIELVLNKLVWTGSRVEFYDVVKETVSKLLGITDIIQEDCKELDNIMLLFKKHLSGNVTEDYRRFTKLVRLSIINGYKDNYKFIKYL